jgi:hypothetical protein
VVLAPKHLFSHFTSLSRFWENLSLPLLSKNLASLSSLSHPNFSKYMIKYGFGSLSSKKQVEEEIKAWFGKKG